MALSTPTEYSRRWTWLALLAAAAATGGSLYLSLGMGLLPCALCFYQRVFAMAACAVLLVGLFAGDRRGPSLSLLALPLAVAGLGVAGFHVSLEKKGILECPRGILELGTAPQQSLGVFVMLTALLVVDVGGACLRPSGGSESAPSSLALIGACLVGGLMAWGCIRSSPPLPEAPKKPYDEPLIICRPPYHEPPHGQ
jgi:disulfide bond formation protein DsbB